MHSLKIVEQGTPLVAADKALILLHGRGGSAADILTLAREFLDGEKSRSKFFVAAPQATNGTWYPYSFMADEATNEPWLSSAVEVVQTLVANAVAALGSQNVYLMGFSQGACLALESATRHSMRLAGVAAFTGGLIGSSLTPAIIAERYRGDFAQTPVFIGNSDRDPHVPLHRSQQSKDIMERLGAVVTLAVYPAMPHTIIPDEIAAVRALMFS
jgi:phospholipase/carboxylesterase